MAYYDLISENDESTVVAEFENGIFAAEAPYMSERNLEDQFVAQLGTQEYELLPVSTEAELISNLRRQLELLNGVSFADGEWKRFFTTCITKRCVSGCLKNSARIWRNTRIWAAKKNNKRMLSN